MSDRVPAEAPMDEPADEGGYLVGSRPIDHSRCTLGASGVWYPNFGSGVEIFGWAHHHTAYLAELRQAVSRG